MPTGLLGVRREWEKHRDATVPGWFSGPESPPTIPDQQKTSEGG